MLSSLAIRRMLWDVVLAVPRAASHVFHWVAWQLAHRTHASQYHARRRERAMTAETEATTEPDADGSAAPGPTTTAPGDRCCAMPAPPRHGPPIEAATDDILTTVWERLAALLAAPKRGGRSIVYDRRRIFEAIVYVMRTDCGWIGLPSSFPPWKTVQECYVQWCKTGIWETIWKGIDIPGPCPRE